MRGIHYPPMDHSTLALLELGRALRSVGYHFVTVTAETHKRVNRRKEVRAQSLRDVFGYSRPFKKGVIPDSFVDLLRGAGALGTRELGYISTVRFSSLGPHLFVHSAYPTEDASAVFFGPDTYRFCAMLNRSRIRADCLVDVGCGSGAGGIVMKSRARRVILADINEHALRYARVNAALAGVEADVVESDLLTQVEGPIDCIVANPPYLIDENERLYRAGGGRYGESLAVRIVEQSLKRLPPSGQLFLYTGAAVVDGRDTFFAAIESLLRKAMANYSYNELDPDVFGEELDRPAYAAVERIAVVELAVTASSGCTRDTRHAALPPA